MSRIVFLCLGIGTGVAWGPLLHGCECPADTVHDIVDGTYEVEPAARNEIGADTDYTLTVSNGSTIAVEAFTRDGHSHRHEYSVSEATDSTMGPQPD